MQSSGSSVHSEHPVSESGMQPVGLLAQAVDVQETPASTNVLLF